MKRSNGEPTSASTETSGANHEANCAATGATPAGNTPTISPDESGLSGVSRWSRIATLAGLAVLGITPWAQAQLAPLDPPPAVICPPLTAIATPTLFDVFFGTTPIRFPFQ